MATCYCKTLNNQLLRCGDHIVYCDMRGRDLRWMNLKNEDLRMASLRGADLSHSDLRYVRLDAAHCEEAMFQHADLRETSLYSTDLRRADFRWADLRCADLRRTILKSTLFDNAKLEGTCLDPVAKFKPPTPKEITESGMIVDGRGRVQCYRTDRSVHVGDIQYLPGLEYVAPVFSVSTETECHPGLYVAGLQWLLAEYSDNFFVVCECDINNMIKVGSKFRVKKLLVKGYVNRRGFPLKSEVEPWQRGSSTSWV